MFFDFFFFQAEDGIRDLVRSRGLGDVYKRQAVGSSTGMYLMYNLFSDDALKAGKDLSSNNFKFEFHPESLTQILSIDNKEFKFENKPISVPIIKFSYSY